ncbi:ComEC/Rec2 family competence protein [Novosphingobium colocasiae]|uniref:Competence protein ComEC n=1 Tax=Novosphingobium colocasiae TaxID=1256513 RepID=A0A918UHI5_9SPHN|nr:ComEC/Rec2 family competence protein [Novosphingobium colocasiae]GGZ08720.1 competence protein ComEC [Novosphingobium colocasiae]
MEQFLGASRLDLGPWLVVCFAAGIAAWFGLPGATAWIVFCGICLILSGIGALALRRSGRDPYIAASFSLIFAMALAGCLVVWARSHVVGTAPIERPMVGSFVGRVLAIEHQSAQARDRLVLATREQGTGRAIKVRVNLPDAHRRPGVEPGALVRFKARLMPPAPPMLPGAYNFARTAWFAGLAASGSALGPVEVVEAGQGGAMLGDLRNRLSAHILSRVDPDAGGIATALVTGDEGALAEGDVDAMRDAGLAHLLSISGLHVSAVIAATFFIVLRLAALIPWLTLRVRLPVFAAGAGALVGIGYTLLSGSEVPTVRSCIGALLVLAATVLGRESLSLRMLAVGAFFVLLLWPEALVGPSFQLSFAAVLAIIAVSSSAPARRFLAPRDEWWPARLARNAVMIVVTGLVIEMALMPIGFYHFHRAGVYGALANVIAIPLTTFAIMPLLGLSLLLDTLGLGAPFWWLTAQAIALLLAIARFTAGLPGAVTVLPAFGIKAFALFVAGGLWLGLWPGRVRWLGLPPVCAGTVLLMTLSPPDILLSGDGRTVGVLSEAEGQTGRTLLVLRQSRTDYTRDNLLELSGMQGEPVLLQDWPGARCNRDFCTLRLERRGRRWLVLLSRGRDAVPERALATACERVDIVLSDRFLPRSCHPRWLKADRRMLEKTGGLAIRLEDRSIETVAAAQQGHGWWRPPPEWPRPATTNTALPSGDQSP